MENDNTREPLDKALLERDRKIGQFRALVNKLAHDFNNYLAPLVGWFSLIKEEIEQDSTASAYAIRGEQIARESERKIEEILNAIRPERRFHTVQIDFKKLVEEEINEWKKTIPPSVVLEVYYELDDCIIFSDPDHWRAGVRNLLNNARYGLALGGRLEVYLKRVQLNDEDVGRYGVKEKDLWLLKVVDNGLGMSKEVLERAFEPFFTTRSKNQALGLGLTHLHSLARLQGGQVIIESEEGKGTTVYVYFASEPLKSVLIKSEKEQKSSVKTAIDKNKVLLVDDDPLVLEVLKTILQKKQFEVLTASNGRAALDTFKKKANEIGVIITDVRMPEMNGVEFIENIKKLRADIPILFISGEKDTVLNELMSRFNEKPKLIKKPCTSEEFLNAVEEVLNSKNNVCGKSSSN